MNSVISLEKKTEGAADRISKLKTRITVGMATCGIAAGADEVFQAIQGELKALGFSGISPVETGCIGLCKWEPIVEVIEPDKSKVTYVNMTPEKVRRVVREHFLEGNVVDEYCLGETEQKQFFGKQRRIALRNCGMINPNSIEEYQDRDGFKALEKMLNIMTPGEVIAEIKRSGLRGRGGGGFPTGLKWELAAKQRNPQKYIICNADEGDPGAFMDRSILEGDPFAVVEALTIGGYAIGADQGYIYIRAEYPLAVKRLSSAINKARKNGFLGKGILGSQFNFDIEIRLGAGAFVCGEETALINSIEGKRGIPSPKPPYPAVSGLWGKPTVINNVETLANIPRIIFNGAGWFTGIGSEKSKGTKVFALGGKIKNTGLVEVPIGTTLREVIFDIGGGCPNDKEIKAVQTGGPSGGCIPAELLDTPIDYDSLIALGSMMGSGGMIIMDEDNCMVDVARFYLDFTKDESCGKCTPCRVGTTRLLEMLEKITAGKGAEEDLENLEVLAKYIKSSALCGLGKSAPNPVLSTLKYFQNEYLAHVQEKKCPSGTCKGLSQFFIVAEKCKGCGLCKKQCPAGAISGKPKKPFIIDRERCIKCGVCKDKCRFEAIMKI